MLPASTTAGSTGIAVQPGLEVFGQYALRLTNNTDGTTDWYHRFDLTRAHASLSGSYSIVRGRVVLEAVRSASEGALIGIDGDSLVLRVREAYAAVRPLPWLDLMGGVIPTLTIPSFETPWGARVLAPTTVEYAGLVSPADLGAAARVAFPSGHGWAGVGVYNGEGYTNRELNRGKNVELVAEVHPFGSQAALAPLAVMGGYTLGSSGTGAARADRLHAAVTWAAPRLGAGVTFSHAWGVGNAGDVNALVVEGFVRGEPVPRLLVAARGTYWQRNVSTADDHVWSVLASVGVRVAVPWEAWVAVVRTVPGATALAALPGDDNWEIRAVTRVVF